MKITSIKVEGVKSPVGVDEKRPVFSWQISGNGKDIFQESYRIIVTEGGDFSGKIVWDSKTVNSSNTVCVEYRGKPLRPDTQYTFKVFAVINGRIIESETAGFTTGLLNTEMPGCWLTTEKNGRTDPETCAFVRKNFEAAEIRYATLFVCSYGWYEVFLNGTKPDDRILSPSKGSYDSLLFYEAYDITNLLKNGFNTVSLILGDGYNNNANIYMGRFKGAKRFKACINLHKTDGTVETVATDGTWKFTLDTPWIKNNIYNGEIYDATREIKGWQNTDFDDSKWNSMPLSPLKERMKLYCDIGPYIKITETRKPEKIYDCRDGRYILDFGQNMSGFIRISLSGKRGNAIRIKTAEEIKIDKNDCGLEFITNRGAASTDTYIMNGEGMETYNPHFTYHGFRYAEICGLNKRPNGEEVTACAVHTEFEGYADFKTDNKMINRIYANAFWSVRSNSMSFPSDCAARDERTPCPMDLYCYLKTAMYMLAPGAYYPRYLKNNNIDKIKDGKINMTWNGCLIALPWYFYRYYGNPAYIKRYYYKLKRLYTEYLQQCGEAVPGGTFGDWCAPNDYGNYLTSFSSVSETEYHLKFLTCEMMADMANALRKREDAAYFKAVAKKTAAKYVQCFYNKEKGTFSNGKQAPNLYALADGFLSDSEENDIASRLLKSISENGKHLDLGIYGIGYLVEELGRFGTADTALDCFMNPEYPSFAHQIAKGATTLWEQWCGKGDMSSHNHAMFAGAVSGFYTTLAGVTPTDNGFKKFKIKPVLSRHIKRLDFSFNTVNGKFELHYRIKDGDFILELLIPCNCRADVILPDGEKKSIGNGRYSFICQLEKSKNIIINECSFTAAERIRNEIRTF